MNDKFRLSAREHDEEWKRKIVTPRSAVVGVVESKDRSKLLVIKRKYPPLGYAMPGGMMDIGEFVADTAIREVEEETGIVANPIGILNVISDPEMDPRWHVIVIHVLMQTTEDVVPKGMDDALDAAWVPYDDPELRKKLIEHATISLDDYLEWRDGNINLLKLR